MAMLGLVYAQFSGLRSSINIDVIKLAYSFFINYLLQFFSKLLLHKIAIFQNVNSGTLHKISSYPVIRFLEFICLQN